MAEAAGTVVRKYETLRRLAVGGMGEVFLARERGRLGFSRLVVLKRLLPQLAQNRDFVEMFVDEARIVGNLNHPNICQILELGDEDGVPFLALEYVRGESLSGIWDRAYERRIEIPRAITLRMLADTAHALHFAHEARDADGRPLNVIHRDISPHNIMVTFHGDVKLMDFGIARADNRMHRTDTGKIKGKISYMAPEQLRGEQLDRRADVFSIGVMLWELTLNRRLFGGGNEVETLTKAITCDVPRPRSIDPAYPPALEAIVMNALAALRDDRTPTAGELGAALVEQIDRGVERADIATVMKRLFPDESAAGDDDTIVASIPTTPAPHGTQELRPTVPLRAEPPVRDSASTVGFGPTVAFAEPAPPAPAEPRPTRAIGSSSAAPHVAVAGREIVVAEPRIITRTDELPKRRGPGLAIGLVALATAGAIIAVLATRSEPETKVATALDAGTVVAVVAIDAAPVAAAPEDAAAVAIEDAAVAVAEGPKRGSNKRSTPRVKPPLAGSAATTPPAGSATEVVPVATPAIGTLAISSELVGVVIIDGTRRKSTPFQTELPAGDHDIALELAEGAGTLRTRAHVLAGKKTKCRVDSGALACASP
ncbi:MAG: protein kinase [Myxococcota bacterium]|nr:protein kinase [Myxococcota bacterium]